MHAQICMYVQKDDDDEKEREVKMLTDESETSCIPVWEVDARRYYG